MTEKTAVHTPTKEEYDRLMKAYEKKGWMWNGNDNVKATEYNGYKYGKDTCIEFNNNIMIGDVNYYREDEARKIITVDEAIAKLGLYERGQRVLVRDKENDELQERIYITTIEGCKSPYICVTDATECDFIEGKEFSVCERKYIKPLEPTTLELTMKDIEDKFQCKVKIVK